jgi:peptide/nickel transport system ATP-binding protein
VLRAVAGLIPYATGEITLAGRRVDRRRTTAQRKMAQMVFQDPYGSLHPNQTVDQILAMPVAIHRLDRGEARITQALAEVGLGREHRYRYPHQLSGGQRQRVAIAAALVLEPKLLVADEPVSMLDVSVRAGILDLLDGLRRGGLGILMITHDLSTATQYADRILVMYLGRIVEEGPARTVVGDPRHPYTRALISVVPRRDPHDQRKPQILQGETPNPVDIPAGCRFHPRCPIGDDSCRAVDPQLEPAAGHRAACIKL